jgi:hypothetical protein
MHSAAAVLRVAMHKKAAGETMSVTEFCSANGV